MSKDTKEKTKDVLVSAWVPKEDVERYSLILFSKESNKQRDIISRVKKVVSAETEDETFARIIEMYRKHWFEAGGFMPLEVFMKKVQEDLHNKRTGLPDRYVPMIIDRVEKGLKEQKGDTKGGSKKKAAPPVRGGNGKLQKAKTASA